MLDTLTVTVQMGEGTPSSQTFDLGSDDAAPPPPMDAGDTDTDTGSEAAPPMVDEDDGASGEELSASEGPLPPGLEDDASDGDDDADEETDDDGDGPRPPEV